MTDDIYKIIEKLQVIPVVAFNEVRLALPLADALEEGGLPIVEVTFRTHAAANAIYKIAKERPGVTVGAGTILTITQLKKAVDCGAKFGFAPGFNPKIVEESLKINFPFSPGVMTPSDIEGALSIGVKVLKYFPAEAVGGIDLLNSLIASYGHTGIRFVPTGGITSDNVNEYLKIPNVLAVGGTWIAKSIDIQNKSWNIIKNNCQWKRR